MHYLNYPDIFKNKYPPNIKNILEELILDININNKNEIPLFILYKNIIQNLFKKIQLKSYKEASALHSAKDEVIEMIKELLGDMPYDLPFNTKDFGINNTIIVAYSQAMQVPNTVENYYFEVLDDIIQNKKGDYNSIDSNLDSLKKYLYTKLEEYIRNYSNKFKAYLQATLPEQLDFNNEKVINDAILYINKKLEDTEKILIELKKYFYDYQHKYYTEFNNISVKKEFLDLLSKMKNDSETSEEAKKNIEKFVIILNKQIIDIQKSMDSEYTIYNSKMEVYTSLINFKKQLTKALDRLTNPLDNRLKILQKFEQTDLAEICIEEIDAILNKDEKKIRIYEILKYHVKYSNKILQLYYHIIYNYKDKITEVAKRHNKQGNYYDIFISSQTADRLIITLESINKETISEYEDIVQKILCIIVYKVITTGKSDDLYNKFSFWDDYKEYFQEKLRLSPLEVKEAQPKNFISYIEFKKSDKFKKQLDFNEQFNNYKKNFSVYEAKNITRSLIKLEDTGLNEMDALKEFSPTKLSIFFEENNGIGGVVFIQLENSKWVVASSLKMLFKIKVYDEEELRKYPAMVDIIFNYNTTFQEAYNFFPKRTILGSKKDNLDYISSNTMQYPNVKFAKTKDNKFINIKSANYDNYIKFWEDFYGMKVIENNLYFVKQGYAHVFDDKVSFLIQIDNLFEKTLNNYANKCKEDLDVSGIAHTWAQTFLPLYGIMYKVFTDNEFEINKVDIMNCIVDIISIILLFFSVQDSVKNLLSKSVINAKKLGIKGKKNILIYAIRNTPNLKVELSRILAKTTFDAVGPLPFVSLPTRFPRISRFFRTTFNISRPNRIVTFANVNNVGLLNPEWRVKKLITLPEKPIKSDDYYNNVYEVAPESPYTLNEKDYYIKQDHYIYQVEWDSYSYTWRVINQSNPSFSSYKTPVRWDKEEKRWFTHSAAPIIGMNPLERGNLRFLSKEEVIEVYKFLDQIKKDTSDKLNKVINGILKATPEQQADINKAFEIFMGRYDQSIQLSFIENLQKQAIVFSKIDPKKDIIYNGSFDSKYTKTLISTEENSFYTLNKDDKPFIELFVNTLIDINNNYAYDQNQFNEYISSVFMHTVYHATNLKTNSLAYSEICRTYNTLKYNLERIVKLAVPHLRRYETNVIINDVELLKKYPILHQDVEKLLDAKMLPNANLELIDDLLKSKLNEYILQSDKDVFANPDSTVFLINLLYNLFYDKPRFDKFIKDYNAWFMNLNNYIMWEYKSKLKSSTINNINNSDIGNLNNADLQVIEDSLSIYYSNTAEPINTTFHCILGTAEASYKGSRKNYSFSIYKGNYLNINEVTTCKGSNIKAVPINNQIKNLKKDLKLSDNIGFISIYNPNNKIIGTKFNIKSITYGNPILIHHRANNLCTILYAKKDNYFYSYYSNSKLGKSLSQFIISHNNLYYDDFNKHRYYVDPSIKDFCDFLNNNYDYSIIHYAGANLDLKIKKDIPFSGLKNIKFIKYDTPENNYTKNIEMGQSYAIITKNLLGKNKISVFSERIEMKIEKNSITNNIIMVNKEEFP